MQRNQKIIMTSAAVLIGAGVATYAYYKSKKSNNSHPPLNVYPNVDLEKYLGEWYEIARIPYKYERDCYNTKAIYSKADEGSIKILNYCNKGSIAGVLETAEGKAFVSDKETNAKLKVQFAWPFKGDYWILDVGKDYEYALVGSPDRDHLWILSRTNKINGNSLKKLKNIATREGFDINRLVYTEHGIPEKIANAKEKAEVE
jgi:apolipoprotein D and lipocalin family protein